MNEYFKSLRTAVNDRWAGPLFGNFVLAWLVFNWRILYVTLFVDGDKITDANILFEKHITKLQYINEFLVNPERNLWYPLILTAGFILVYPAISACALVVPEYFATIRNNWKMKIWKTRTVSMDDYAKVVKERNDERIGYIETLKDKEQIAANYDKLVLEKVELNKKLEDLVVNTGSKQDELMKLRSEYDELLKSGAEQEIESEIFLKDEQRVITISDPFIIDSDVVMASTGAISMWIRVPELKTLLQQQMGYIYAFGHDTKQGKSISATESRYENAFAFCLHPNFTNKNKRSPSKLWWNFWITNDQSHKEEFTSPEWEVEKEGWHHFVIRWNHFRPFIEMIIDGKVVATKNNYLKSWPKETSRRIYIGNYPNNIKAHQLGMPITRVMITSEYFDNIWIKNELKQKPVIIEYSFK